jgi:iron complex outermembrane receptor protein
VDSSDQKATGAEFELQWQPSEALRLNATGAWIDSTYGHQTALSGADLSGQPTGEPYWSFALGLSYVWQNVAGGALQFDAQHAYRGKSRCNNDSLLQGDCSISPNFDIGAAQERTDFRLGWTSGDGRWGLAAFVNNAFDQRYVTGVSNISATVFGTPYASINPPRFYGAEVSFKY